MPIKNAFIGVPVSPNLTNIPCTLFLMPRYHDAHGKIERAQKHIVDLKTVIDALPDRYVATIEIDPILGNLVIKHDIRDRDNVGTDLAVIIGDAIHNLRCSLDYAWMETLQRLTPSAITKYSKFPVYPSRDELEKALRDPKRNLCPSLLKFVVSDIQAYKGGNHAIWPIHTLDIDDKHRLLIPVLKMAGIDGIELENENGQTTKGFAWGTTQEPPFFVPIESGWHIKNKGHVSVAIIFDEETPLYGLDVADTLSTFTVFILDIVQRMENLVP
jgi:hypothetical protein